MTSSNHTKVQECEDSMSEKELAKTPETLEDEGQATVDGLKELDLVTAEKPHPIYVSSLLTPEEEKEYFNLPSEYKDILYGVTGKCQDLIPKL